MVRCDLEDGQRGLRRPLRVLSRPFDSPDLRVHRRRERGARPCSTGIREGLDALASPTNVAGPGGVGTARRLQPCQEPPPARPPACFERGGTGTQHRHDRRRAVDDGLSSGARPADTRPEARPDPVSPRGLDGERSGRRDVGSRWDRDVMAASGPHPTGERARPDERHVARRVGGSK